MKFRIHYLALPNSGLTKKFSLCGFSQANMRLIRLLKELGHHVYVYGPEKNECDVDCDELITVITAEERDTLLEATVNAEGKHEATPYQYAFHEAWSPIYQLANARMAKEIEKRKKPRDFICSIGGGSQEPVAKRHPDLQFVEISIGYQGSFSPYRVFESIAWQHYTYGKQGIENVRYFDTVIPLPFDPDEYSFREEKEPFALYVGRLIERKGLVIACRAAEAAKIPLKVIGHGSTHTITNGAEYLGALSDAERNDWMSRAQCVMTPTIYIEPLNSVSIESQLCGTPVVATQNCGLTETIQHGKTGFHCHILGDFVRAIHDCAKLNHSYIRHRAVDKFSIQAVAPQYDRYLHRLYTLWDRGWDTI